MLWQSAAFALGLLATQPPARDCMDMYYGADGPQDLRAAFACFEAGREERFDGPGRANAIMRAVMLLNGEGVAPDPQRAKANFDQANLGNAALKKAIATALAGGKVQHLDPCRDLLLVSPNGDCADVLWRSGERAGKAEIDHLRAELPGPQARALDRLEATFEPFEQAEAEWTRVLLEDREEVCPAALEQMQRLRSHFMQRLDQVVRKRRISSTGEAAFREADARLNFTYRAKFELQHAEPGTEVRRDGESAQLAWIQYREAWAAMASALLVPGLSSADRQLAVRTLITLDRVEELNEL